MPDQTPRTFSISSINGFGSKTYGKTDFAADGSYITTCWVIACYVPLIPTESWRAWEIVEKKRLFGLIPYTDNSNFYAQDVPLHRQQVLRVYLYILPLLAIILSIMTGAAFDAPSWLANTVLVLLILWAFLPWYLRRRARRRLTQPPAKPKSVTNQ